MASARTCVVCEVGLIEYGKAWELQKRLHAVRVREGIPDVLLLLEHLPTITIGKSGSMDNILASPQDLSEMGISLFLTDRGGDVTYHGPGQVMAYPIMNLRNRGKDIYRFVTDLEEVMIRTAADFGVSSGRDHGHRGVWVGWKELGAIGLAVRKWVTMHGLALNVNTNLGHFEIINPCGFKDRQATSLAACLSHEVPLAGARNRTTAHFSDIFDVSLVPVTLDELNRMITKHDKGVWSGQETTGEAIA